MDSIDYWRLCDEVSVVQAALLLVGSDPSGTASYVEGWSVENRPDGYEAAKTAIANALRNKRIEGAVIPLTRTMSDPDGLSSYEAAIEDSIDTESSRVDVVSLTKWLASRGFSSGFFFPDGGGVGPAYLDPQHPHYAPKLAAAVRAWLAVESEQLSGRSPKQALVKWLRENAAQFAMSDEDGKPNETGIEEAAKVANWQPGGGAPKSPGS